MATTLGRSLGPTHATGGGFTLLSQKLASRPSGSAIFKGDGIAFTVSHELFHLVQFGYVAQGMPDWVAEGTANTLAFFFTNVDHPVILHQGRDGVAEPVALALELLAHVERPACGPGARVQAADQAGG